MRAKTILLAALLTITAQAQQTIDLSGQWQLSLDSVQPARYNDVITLPSTLDMAGKGTPNTLSPKLEKPQLSRLTRKFSHIGPAWYQREVTVPESMANRPLELRLERVLWKSRLYIDGKDTGLTQESLTTPHLYRIEQGLTAGSHVLTLMIDNRQQYDISVDQLCHSYTNDTQTKWNGVLGEMTLRALPDVYINKVEVFPDVKRQKVRVIVTLSQMPKTPVRISVDNTLRQELRASGITSETEIDIPDMKTWSEFCPTLYRLRVEAGDDVRELDFGMREIATEGNRLLMNGYPVFLRGTLECCVFPLTGAPAMDERGWLKTFETAREWGLNHLRFHSWCPPEAAFRVADRLGMYLQVELPVWSLTVNKDSATSRFLYDEAERILTNYGNHPSLCIISCGNELQPDFKFLNQLTAWMKQRDPRHLYATSSFTFEKGHGQHPEPEDQVFITQWTDHGWVRGQGVFDEQVPEFRTDYRDAARDVRVPLIAHEIGQYAVYPNIAETEKYTGVLDPLNFKAIQGDLRQKGLLSKAPLYTQASGRLAALLYKEEIERAMKTPQQSGIQLLGLQDFPGQGTALVGLLDAFWDSKGVIEPSRFREFCAPVVPLAWFDKAVWTQDETFRADLGMADYSMGTLASNRLVWEINDEQGCQLFSGEGNSVSASLAGIREATRLELVARIDGTPYRNRWSFWVYPNLETHKLTNLKTHELILTQDIDEAVKQLKRGKRVLFSPRMEQVNGLEGKFLPVFWSPVHFPKQAGTMGLLAHPEHPALRHFPTDQNSDWQWWRLVKRSRVMVLDSIPQVDPIVESVDNFVRNRRLARVFEARVGKGSLLMSSFDLIGSELPEARQLLYSLQQYVASPDFQPRASITEAELRQLVLREAKEEKTGATSIYE